VKRRATLNFAPIASSNSALRYAVSMLVGGVKSKLFLDGAGDMLQDLVDGRRAQLTPAVVDGRPFDFSSN